MENMNNAPEKKFSTGSIVAAVWSNKARTKSGEETEFKTVTLQRRYKDKDGKWKSSSSLRLNDLPKAVMVLNKAYEYLVLRDGDAEGAIHEEDVEVENLF